MTTLLGSARRILPLTWPVLVGQLAVLAFSLVDTVLVARYSGVDLAALAVGSAAYVSVFVTLMGVALAIGPISGQLFGAGRLPEAGRQLHQSMWLALGLSVAGCLLLAFPAPFLWMSEATPAVAAKVRGYLGALACALPASLLFTTFRGFSNAISQPRRVMVLQVGGLLIKVPLSALLVFGAKLDTPLGALALPSLGVVGCGVATATVTTTLMLLAWRALRRDAVYAPFLLPRRLARPDRASLVALLRLGVPMGLSIGVEVTGFTFMAIFISRLGATPVAGHQIAANIVSMLYMVPLSLGNATGTLVAQAIGANDPRDADCIGAHGVALAALIATALGGAVFLGREHLLHAYTNDPVIIAAAIPLLAWVMFFHVGDAVQTVAAFVLRAHRIATVPLVIYACASWGIGLGGGYAIAFDTPAWVPPALHGARGFWAAATAGVAVTSTALVACLWWLHGRAKSTAPHRAAPATDLSAG